MLKRILLETHRSSLRPLLHLASAHNQAEPALKQNHIDEAIKVEPNLAVYTPEIWQRAHSTFSNHGLETVNFLRIVTSNPKILQRTPQRIIDTLEIWRSCQFGEKLLLLLITKYPELMDVTDGQHLLSHIAYLKSRVSTNKNVWKLLMNCPDILAQSEQSLEDKFNYFIDVMHIEVPEIVKSSALSRQLTEIRCRHVFLERLGLFTPRSPKAETHEPNTNHRLYQITDTSEKSFATKICHVTMTEFEAFQALYAREQKRKHGALDELSDDENF